MNILEAKEKIILDIGSAEKLGVENSPEIRLISSQQQIKRLLLNENWRAIFPPQRFAGIAPTISYRIRMTAEISV